MKRIIAVVTFAVFAAPAWAQDSKVVSAAVAESSLPATSVVLREPGAERTELTTGYFDPSN
jgi:hypothetical protein